MIALQSALDPANALLPLEILLCPGGCVDIENIGERFHK